MKVQVLPCLVCIVDSLVVDKLIGFDDLGGSDQFTTKQLEDRLASQSRRITCYMHFKDLSFFLFLFVGIFNVPHRLKKSADRRDRGDSSDSDNNDF